MEWTEVSVFTSSIGVEFVCDMFSNLGITGAVIEDEQDFINFLEENKKYWDYVDDELIEEKKKETRVKVYIENSVELSDKLALIKSELLKLSERDEKNEWGTLAIDTESLSQEDWANNWKKFFHPIEVGKRILIQPEWEPLKAETDRVVFTVNPGMTFGTGTHHTTKLCVEELEGTVTEDTELLDIGCGSGILSIISLLLGAKEAWAADIDPACEHVAKENALLNGVDTSKYHIFSGDIITDKGLFDTLSVRKYDVIAANIVADVIIALVPTVKALLKKDGTFVCSGIIEERLSDVLAAFEKGGICVQHEAHSGGWVAMRCELAKQTQ